jgi:hypothetical protein
MYPLVGIQRITCWKETEQQKAFAVYAVDNSIPTSSPYQWGLVEKIVELLRPFEEITNEASKIRIYHFSELWLFIYFCPSLSKMINSMEFLPQLKSLNHQLRKDFPLTWKIKVCVYLLF